MAGKAKDSAMGNYFNLVGLMKSRRKVAVLFSGGKDSCLVAKAAIDAGIETAAFTISSPLFSRKELKNSEKMAKEIGIQHIVIKSDYIPKNDNRRCYRCKKNMIKLVRGSAKSKGFDILADGTTIDDMKDETRIGTKAADEEGIWHPLLDAGFNEKEVISASSSIGLSVWNKPSNSCIATRISYGEEITAKKIDMVEKAEEFLQNSLGETKRIRVRVHGGIARIEVPAEDFEKILEMRDEIIERFKKIGFTYTALDLSGYRSGSMNEELGQLWGKPLKQHHSHDRNNAEYGNRLRH